MKDIVDFINEQLIIESKPFMSDDPEIQSIVNILEYPQDVKDMFIKDGDVYIIPSRTTAERFGLYLKPAGDALNIGKYKHFYAGKRTKVINSLTINCENVKKIRDIEVLPDQFEYVTIAHANSNVVNDYFKKVKPSELRHLTLNTSDDIDIEPAINLHSIEVDWGFGWNGPESFSINAKSHVELLDLKSCPSIKSLPAGLKELTLANMKIDCFKEFDSETFKKHTNVDNISIDITGSSKITAEEVKKALKGEAV